MNNIVKYKEIKKRLDEIDGQVYRAVHDGYYNSRLRVLVGMWEKGEAISVEFKGVKSTPSYRELERQTGRTDDSLKSWHDLYEKYPDKEKYIKKEAEPRALRWAENRLKAGLLLASGLPEWWTPKKYIDAVHEVMGEIDLDPASCAEANKTIRAREYYDEMTNGLEHSWRGRVFLNPPYGDGGPPFIEKLFGELKQGITEAILLVNSRSTDTEWFQSCFDGVICFSDHRIDFDSPNEKETSSTHGSCFIYFGPNQEKFAKIFSQFGNVVRRWPDA